MEERAASAAAQVAPDGLGLSRGPPHAASRGLSRNNPPLRRPRPTLMRHFPAVTHPIPPLARGVAHPAPAARLVPPAGLPHPAPARPLATRRTAVRLAPIAAATDPDIPITFPAAEKAIRRGEHDPPPPGPGQAAGDRAHSTRFVGWPVTSTAVLTTRPGSLHGPGLSLPRRLSVSTADLPALTTSRQPRHMTSRPPTRNGGLAR